MNDNRQGSFIAIFLGVLASLYAIFSIILTQGNSISELCLMLMVSGLLLSLAAPKVALTFWIISSGYIDLLKRLMVVSGRVTHSDLYNVLGIHPLMLGGLTLSLLIGGLLGRQRLCKADFWRLLTALFLMAVTAGMSAREKGLSPSSILADVANSGLYAALIFIIPLMVPNLEQALKTLRLVVLTFIPVAIYGVVQQVMGFQDFEIEYLMTGLSIEIKQLFTHEVRAFSTLNSPTALGFGCGACMIFCIILGWHRDLSAAKFRFPKALTLVFMIIFLAGLISATMRSAFVMVPVGIMGSWIFSKSSRTKMFYATVTTAFVTLVIGSKWILQVLPQAMTYMYELSGGSTFADQMLRVGTYYERLMGFSNCLANPAAYTLFGLGADRGRDYADEFMNHDPLSTILIRYGAPALIVSILLGALALKRVHHSVLKLPAGALRRTSALLLCVPVGFMMATLLQGSVFSTFPLNLMVFLSLGLVEALGRSLVMEESQQKVVSDSAVPQGPRKRMPVMQPARYARASRPNFPLPQA
jgi:hypothetical protein